MCTSTINYRVADFLKCFPPFEFLEEAELLDLARHGWVKLHQRGEALFWEGREPGPCVFVIKQGTVRLVNDTDEGEELRGIVGVPATSSALGASSEVETPTSTRLARRSTWSSTVSRHAISSG